MEKITKSKYFAKIFKDDDYGEKGYAYEVRRKAGGAVVEMGHTYDHDWYTSDIYADERAETFEINNMSIRQINAYFRKTDESRKWPICGRFNATERAIRRLRKVRSHGCGPYPGLEYYLALKQEISEIVNAEA